MGTFKKPIRTSSPTIRSLIEKMDRSGISYSAACRTAGIHKVTLTKWKGGSAAPSLPDFENVAQAIGYRLEFVPLETEE